MVNAFDGLLVRVGSLNGPGASRLAADEESAALPGRQFIFAAVRRGIRLWAATGLLGMVAALGFSVLFPAAAQVSTTIVFTYNPADQPSQAVLTVTALAHSRTVAERALHELGLRQSISSFLAAYTVADVSSRILVIDVGAPTVPEAEAQAQAIATTFLAYRAQLLQAQQRLVLQAIDQQLSRARQGAAVAAKQLSAIQADPPSPLQRGRLKKAEALSRSADAIVTGLQQAPLSYRLATAAEVADSRVLDGPAPIAHNHRLSPAEEAALVYACEGLVGGLVVGLAFVVVRALVSDRLRRRDDVAHALGAPVRLSVGPVRKVRWRPGGGGLAAAGRPEVQRVVAHLQAALPWRDGRMAGLAVVAVDELSVPALSVVSLALSYAREGRQVVLADLCPGVPAARLLGVRDPGIGMVSADGVHLTVVVPGDSVMPAGPLRPAAASAARPSRELAQACQGADVLLSLVRLDPSLGGEHLATWAGSAVVMVTAGRASWAKIHAVGEMIQLAGTSLVSAVLIGADKTDESLGAAHPHPPAHDTTPVLAGDA